MRNPERRAYFDCKVILNRILGEKEEKEIREALQEVRQILQQKPEIDDMKKYVEEKAEYLIHITRYYGLPVINVGIAKDFITQIISDVRGGAISKENLKISEAKIKEK